MDPYARVKIPGGKLKFKRVATCASDGVASGGRKLKARRVRKEKEESELVDAENVPVVSGQGRVVSSGTTLQGFETSFKEELTAGDEVLVLHPSSLKVENRTVVGILSQRSLTMNQPFSSDLISTTVFEVKKDSERLKRLAEKQTEKNKIESGNPRSEDEMDTHGGAEGEQNDDCMPSKRPESSSTVLADEVSRQLQKKLNDASKYQHVTYREKTGMWGYKTVTERVKISPADEKNDALSAERLLDIRTKKMGRDKYCW